jgi:hypothetical protein
MNAPERKTDLDLRVVAMAAVAVMLMLLLAAVAAWLAWVSWHPGGARASPGARLDFGITGPRLERRPFAQRPAERALPMWAPDQRQAGIARVPVEDAMRVLAARRAQGSGGERP